MSYFGKIYVLENEAMPSTYKVGLTSRTVDERIKELNNTSVPKDFAEIASYTIPIEKLSEAEYSAHRELKNKGLHYGKEFFKGDLITILNTVEYACEDYILDESSVEVRTKLLYSELVFKRDRLIAEIAKWNELYDPNKIESVIEYKSNINKNDSIISNIRNSYVSYRGGDFLAGLALFSFMVGTIIFGIIDPAAAILGPVVAIILFFVGSIVSKSDSKRERIENEPKRNKIEEIEGYNREFLKAIEDTKKEYIRYCPPKPNKKYSELTDWSLNEIAKNYIAHIDRKQNNPRKHALNSKCIFCDHSICFKSETPELEKYTEVTCPRCELSWRANIKSYHKR